jgi:arginyl-tRNA synthetase
VRFREAMKDRPDPRRPRAGPGSSGSRTASPRCARAGSSSATPRGAEFERVYKILGIEFEEVRGESAYEPALAGVMKELDDKGLISISEGATVVAIPGEKTPLLLRKQDGSTLYATRDVAAAEYHWETYHFTRKLYVVGREQALHFRQLYKALAMAGHTWAGTMDGEKYTPGRLQHVAYGHIRLGGQKTATRLGNVVLMNRVFDIMQDEQRPRIAEKNPDKTPEEIDARSRAPSASAPWCSRTSPRSASATSTSTSRR